MEAEPCERTQASLRYAGFKEKRVIGNTTIRRTTKHSSKVCWLTEEVRVAAVALSVDAAYGASVKKTRGCS